VCHVCSGGASAVKEPGHFEVRKIFKPGHPESGFYTEVHFFLKKVDDQNTGRPPTPLIVSLSK